MVTHVCACAHARESSMQKPYPSNHILPFHFRSASYANASRSHFGKVGKIDGPPRAPTTQCANVRGPLGGADRQLLANDEGTTQPGLGGAANTRLCF
jgi:hypothetical protein